MSPATNFNLPRLGDTFVGKYTLEAEIGEGGFARVYRAVDATIGRQVAVKLLLPGADGNYEPTLAARFVREAKLLAGLKDPHTLQLFDFGTTDDGLLFMVSELLTGEDLSSMISSRGIFAPSEVLHVVVQLCASLREAHAAGVLHRDIKPSNIRVYEYGGDPLRVKLMDFGVARSIDEEEMKLTQTGAMIGTLAYMSPEQLQGDRLTPASDLFSVALTACEMLNGQVRTTRQAVFAGRVPEVPADDPLRGVLQRLLSPIATQRFQTAQEVEAILAPHDTFGGLSLITSGVYTPQSGPVYSPSSSPNPSAPEPPQTYPSSSPSRPVSGAQSRPLSGAQSRPLAPPQNTNRVVVVVVALAVVSIGLSAWLLAGRTEPVREADGAAITKALQSSKSDPAKPSKPSAAVGQTPPLEVPDVGTLDAGPKLIEGCGSEPEGVGRDFLFSTKADRRSVDWRLYYPKRYDRHHRHPVIFLFHTDSESGGAFMQQTRIREFADKEGIVVIVPEGSGFVAWPNRFSPEVGTAIIADAGQAACLDLERVYAIGHGSGGLAVEGLSCAPWLAAASTTAHRSESASFPCPDRSVPYLMFTPLLSRHVPRSGGSNCTGTRQIVSLETQEKLWRHRNTCDDAKPKQRKIKGAICYEWSCETALASCHVDAGHNWPGVPPRGIDLLGCDGPAAETDYLRESWKFFEAQH